MSTHSQYQNIQIRRDIDSNFQLHNPVLKQGELARSTDSKKLKIGDGATAWNDLPEYIDTDRLTYKAFSLVPLAAINANGSVLLNVDVSDLNLDSSLDYSTFISPNSLPDYVIIKNSWLGSNNDTLYIRFLNIESSLDGGGVSSSTPVNASSETLISFAALILRTEDRPIPSVTTTQPPVIRPQQLYSTGKNEFGQLAQGNTTDLYELKINHDDTDKWVDADLGYYHSLAVKSGVSNVGELYAAGYNYYGQLGNGENGAGKNKTDWFSLGDSRYFRDGTEWTENTEAFSQVSAGSHHSFAIDASGYLFSFGNGSYGVLGQNNVHLYNKPTLVGHQKYYHHKVSGENWFNSTASQANSPFQYNGSAGTFLEGDLAKYVLAVGTFEIKGVQSQFALKLESTSSNISISSSQTVTHNSEDYYYGDVTITVTEDFGTASLYSLIHGYGTNGEDIFLYEDPNSSWSDVDGGNSHSLGIKNGKLYTWGRNNCGQLGNNDHGHNDVTFPTAIMSSKSNWVTVAAGKEHSLALDADGDVYAFGCNDHGQLGLNVDSEHVHNPTKINFDSLVADNTFEELAYDSTASVVDFNGEKVFVFHSGVSNPTYDPVKRYIVQSGNYIIKDVPSEYPLAILNAGQTNNISYTGDNFHGCIEVTNTNADGKYNFYHGNIYLTVSGTWESASTYSFYDGYMGGQGALLSDKPHYVVEDIDAGLSHSVLRVTPSGNPTIGTILTFGANGEGQLGTGDNLARKKAYRVNIDNVREIAAGGNQTLAIDKRKYIWSMGNNQFGQLGLGDKVKRNLPSRINSEIKWDKVYTNGFHSMGGVFCFQPSTPTSITVENASNPLASGVGYGQLALSWEHSRALEEIVTHYKISYLRTGDSDWVTVDNVLKNYFADGYEGGVPPNVDIPLTFKLDNLVSDPPDYSKSYLIRISGVNSAGDGEFIEATSAVVPEEADNHIWNAGRVQFYSHLDSGNLFDLTGNTTSIEEDFETNAPRYLSGKFATALRLYHYDSVCYTTSTADIDHGTVEFYFRPRNNASNSPIVTLSTGTQKRLELTYSGDKDNGYSISARDKDNLVTLTSPVNTGINEDTFVHVALVKTSGDPTASTATDPSRINLFIDGSGVAFGKDDVNYGTITHILLGSGTNFYDFDIDELRVSNSAVYDDYDGGFLNSVPIRPYGR